MSSELRKKPGIASVHKKCDKRFYLTGVAQAQAYLEEIAVSLRFSSIPVEIHVHQEKEDNVAHSIVQHFQGLNADLVIMCTHGHGGLRELLFGSKAQQALQQGVSPRV